MNTTFNFSRFLKVLRNEWRLNLKKMLLFWGCMIIVGVMYFAYFRYGKETIIAKNLTFMLFLFLLCILQGFYLQIYYHEFSSKTKTQALLLLPASRNETFWAKFLLGVILYFVLFSAYLFFALKWNGMHNDWMKEIKAFPPDDWRYIYFDNYQTFRMNLLEKLICFLFWLFSAAAFLFGNICFKKQPAFKSLVFWFVKILGIVLITYSVYALLTGVWPSIAVPGVIITTNSNNYECTMVQIYPELLYGFGIFICLALIGIARIKYNEKTI
jgi:hypothetical protein